MVKCAICGREIESVEYEVGAQSEEDLGFPVCKRCSSWVKKISDDYVMSFGSDRGQG
jgi:formate dehydrogenase maturation protein FdhE